MGKRLIALGFIMLIVGSILLGWGLYVQKSERQILDAIKFRLDKLDQVNSDDGNIRELADIFTSNDWKQKLETYNSKRESRELLVNTSAVFIFAAGLILMAWFVVWLFGIIWNLIHKKQQGLPEKKEGQKVVIIEPQNKDPANTRERTNRSKPAETEHLKILEQAGWHNFNAGKVESSQVNRNKCAGDQNIKSFADALNSTPQSLELLFSDERIIE
jgi:hypothetical protein